MEEMVSQLSVMVEDLQIERRYALSTLAGRRIREAQAAVEQARVLVSVAVNVGESDARRRMDDTLLSRVTLRGQAVAATLEAEATGKTCDECSTRYDDNDGPTCQTCLDWRVTGRPDAEAVAAEDAVDVDYAVDYD